MQTETSYGIIPLKKEASGTWEMLLVFHKKGFWAFPKGHAESGETPEKTAERELEEETGLRIVEMLPFGPFQEHYIYRSPNGALVDKTVVYFAALVAGKIQPQLEEIQECRWLPAEEAIDQITFKESKNIAESIKKLLDF